MRKLWLTFTAMLFCSIASFAQITPVQPNQGEGTEDSPYKIDTPAEFMWINSDNDAHYELTADINLEDLGTLNTSIIPTFSGTFKGNKKTITYQAGFQGVNGTLDYSLFGSVSGTINYLNVNANVTLGGSVNNMNVALICGSLTSTGVIEYCNVSGNVNSTVDPSLGGSDAGLIVGESSGTVKYCTGSGNVVGVGYVGGLIGQTKNSASVLACSFTGSVKAVTPDGTPVLSLGLGSFAGGICGYASSNTQISFCVADETITSGWVTSGIASVIAGVSEGNASVNYTYADGELIVTEESTWYRETITSNTTNSSNNNNTGNYYGDTNSVNNLETARINEGLTGFYFAVINGELVLVIGEKPTTEVTICEAPIEFTVTKDEDNYFTARWTMESQDYEGSYFVLTVSGGDLETAMVRNVQGTNFITSNQPLPASANPYVFTVKSKCSEESYSAEVTYSFYVNENCNTVSNLQASDVTSTSANITWQGNAAVVKLGDEEKEFTNGETLALSGLDPATTYTIEAIVYCLVEGENVPRPTSITFTTHGAAYETAKTGDFNDPNTWSDGAVPQGEVANIKINQGHIVTVYHDLKITETYKITENNGALRISQNGGQLINTTPTNVPGIVEIESVTKDINTWSFVGAPFAGYQLKAVVPYPNSDVAMVEFDYGTGKWSTDWATVNTPIGKGEGVFAWPFYDGTMSFTTYGDMCKWNDEEQRYEIVGYDFDREGRTYGNCDYVLNNGDVTVEETVKYIQDNANTQNVNEAGKWMALANPYPAKLNVYAFKGANNLLTNLQGKCVYVFRNGSFDINATDILMTEGFFVNFAGQGQETKSVTFTKEQLSYYYQPATGAKSSANELIELTLQNGNEKVRVYFAHNEEAEQGYDIFDANKMFATTGVAEPYFVTEGTALIKEEVAELPYYATMNVRSQEDTVMNFVLTNLPEGYAVSIIDGEEVIDMVEGGVYSTEILTGENADRFKVLVKKNVGIADVEELDVTITNNNRQVNITADKAVRTEVYNILGQKVFETHNTTFVLDNVASGAYVVKVYGASASKTQKIVVE